MRFNILWLIAAFLFSVSACAEEKGTLDRVYEGAQKAAEKVFGLDELPHAVNKNKQPQIIIKGGELRYNGHPLKFGDTYSNWVKVLGKPSRFSGYNYHTWDNLGIAIVLKAGLGIGEGNVKLEINTPQLVLFSGFSSCLSLMFAAVTQMYSLLSESFTEEVKV